MIGFLIGGAVFAVAAAFYAGIHFGQAVYDRVDVADDMHRTATW